MEEGSDEFPYEIYPGGWAGLGFGGLVVGVWFFPESSIDYFDVPVVEDVDVVLSDGGSGRHNLLKSVLKEVTCLTFVQFLLRLLHYL